MPPPVGFEVSSVPRFGKGLLLPLGDENVPSGGLVTYRIQYEQNSTGLFNKVALLYGT